jgi:protein TonB
VSRSTTAYQYSIGMHILILGSVFLMSRHMDIPAQVVRMDFSLLESSSSPIIGEDKSDRPAEVLPALQPSSVRNIVKEITPEIIQPAMKEPSNPTVADTPVAQAPTGQTAETDGSGKEAAPPGHNGGESNLNDSSAGANSSTQESKRQLYLKEQFEYIRQKIMRQLTYPGIARKMGWTGQATVAFTIMENGRVSGFRIVHSSGFDLLDADAVDTVKRSSPFPRPPVRAEIVMPITYQLK